jgi:predicted phosphodiesterase
MTAPNSLPPLRLALLSDIHGNLPALEAVAAAMAGEGLSAVANLGDIASGPLWPRETVRWLRARDWPTIAGNHERQVLTLPRERMGSSDRFAAQELHDEDRAWLAALPAVRWLAPDLFACHGTPSNDLRYLLETVTPGFVRGREPGVRAAAADEVAARLGAVAPATLVVCGHTHVPRVVRAPGGALVANPGSVGMPAFDDTHPHPHVVETGSPHARWAVVERALGVDGAWHVQLRATAYDHEAAARRAEANGRPDWADALRTGRVGRMEGEIA